MPWTCYIHWHQRIHILWGNILFLFGSWRFDRESGSIRPKMKTRGDALIFVLILIERSRSKHKYFVTLGDRIRHVHTTYTTPPSFHFVAGLKFIWERPLRVSLSPLGAIFYLKILRLFTNCGEGSSLILLLLPHQVFFSFFSFFFSMTTRFVCSVLNFLVFYSLSDYLFFLHITTQWPKLGI